MSSRLDSLRDHVQAACGEFDAAIIFYATWKVAMDDEGLHDRLGVSYSTNAFRAIVTALRRELLLAMLRLWDKDRRAIGLHRIVAEIRDPSTIQLLAEARGPSIKARMISTQPGSSGATVDAIVSSIRDSLDEKAVQVSQIAARYEHGGPQAALLEKLRTLRNERLAHFEVQAASVPEKNASDEEIEQFYRDNAELTRLLRSLVLAQAFDPDDAAGIHRTYASFFWASVRGERTAGHPNYRPPPEDVSE